MTRLHAAIKRRNTARTTLEKNPTRATWDAYRRAVRLVNREWRNALKNKQGQTVCDSCSTPDKPLLM